VGGAHGADWIAIGFGLLLDLLSYTGRYSQRMVAARR
jgi:hypothetical protein